MKTFSGRPASQSEMELRSFIDLLKAEKVATYLEIGARHGDSFHEIMRHLPKGSKGVAVDLPGGKWGNSASRRALDAAIEDLKALGYDASAIYGDSTAAGVRQLIAARGPYDAILIDGDHSLPGVTADWEFCRSRARIIAFHDIAGQGEKQKRTGHLVEVPFLWDTLKHQHEHQEFIDPSYKMGIGVLFL
jgi:cephalosporin hydroxylase